MIDVKPQIAALVEALKSVKGDEEKLARLLSPASKVQILEVLTLFMDAQTNLLNAALATAAKDLDHLKASTEATHANLNRCLDLARSMVTETREEEGGGNG